MTRGIHRRKVHPVIQKNMIPQNIRRSKRFHERYNCFTISDINTDSLAQIIKHLSVADIHNLRIAGLGSKCGHLNMELRSSFRKCIRELQELRNVCFSCSISQLLCSLKPPPETIMDNRYTPAQTVSCPQVLGYNRIARRDSLPLEFALSDMIRVGIFNHRLKYVMDRHMCNLRFIERAIRSIADPYPHHRIRVWRHQQDRRFHAYRIIVFRGFVNPTRKTNMLMLMGSSLYTKNNNGFWVSM